MIGIQEEYKLQTARVKAGNINRRGCVTKSQAKISGNERSFWDLFPDKKQADSCLYHEVTISATVKRRRKTA
uniref:Uncharacterized protein n=1 Tax=viral metagenome TaxID=1070528 RepID=A0A6M3L9G6_9ZZZZ